MRMKTFVLIAFASASITALCAGAVSEAQGGVRFDVRRIGSARTEACGVADFNNDGRPDIIAGPYLYLAPAFRPVKVREVKTNVTPDGKGYANDFMNLPLDVNNDGRIDVISGDWFCKETWWIENALPSTNIWHQHLIERTGNIETGILVDIDGDGKATDFFPDTQLTCLYTPSGDGSSTFSRPLPGTSSCQGANGESTRSTSASRTAAARSATPPTSSCTTSTAMALRTSS